MRDILIDGLPILDLLELTPNINSVARWVNCDQSSVSRSYRRVSAALQLGFRKCNGTYRAHTNLELLASLRQSSQLLRLQRGAAHLHWVGSPWNGAALARIGGVEPLPLPWGLQRRTLELLESRVLDLAVLDLADVEPLDPAPWSSVPRPTTPQRCDQRWRTCRTPTPTHPAWRTQPAQGRASAPTATPVPPRMGPWCSRGICSDRRSRP